MPGLYSKGQVDTLLLYNLSRDPGERYNVIAQHPEIVERLQKLANEVRADLGDNLTHSKGANRRPPGRIPKPKK